MKSGSFNTLDDLGLELERQANSKQDFLVDTTALRMGPDGSLRMLGVQSFETRPIAHSQISQHTGIPAQYYNKLLEVDGSMLAQNVNFWFDRKGEKRMVRTLDGKARAFLSDRFSLGLENIDIVNTVLPFLRESGTKIESFEVTESRLYIKAVYPKMEGEVARGDVVQGGVVISNSEVGMGALTIRPMIYRLVCQNGAIMADEKFSARHLGARHVSGQADITPLLTPETLKADDHALKLKVRDVIRASFSEIEFTRRLDTLRQAKEQKIEATKVEEVIELVSKKYSFTAFERDNTMAAMIEGEPTLGGADLSVYGLSNAVTKMAQRVDSYDRSTELETIGAAILTLPKSEYKVLEAA